MGLFSRQRGASDADALLDSWRGELNGDLWSSDDSGEQYAEKSMELEVALAEVMLAGRSKDPLPAKQRARLTQMLRLAAPSDSSLIGDAATSAFLLARAENWAEFSPDTARDLIESCCADA